jgi:hypothetical protein
MELSLFLNDKGNIGINSFAGEGARLVTAYGTKVLPKVIITQHDLLPLKTSLKTKHVGTFLDCYGKMISH